MISSKASTPRPKRVLALACLLACACTAQADNLLDVWRAAQARDPVYMAARQTLQQAQRAPQLQLQLANARLRLAEQELALRAATAYFELLAARQSAELGLAQLNAMAQQLRLAQRSAQAGAATNAELREARARFDAARTQRVDATQELEQKRAELEKIAGRGAGALDGLRADASIWLPQPSDAGFWAEQASEGHPRVRLRQAALNAAADEVARARDGLAPSVDITANRARIFSDGALNTPAEMAIRSRSAQLGLVFTVPLSEGGPDSRLREALAAQDRSEAELAVARGQAAAQARQALAGLSQSLSRADAMAQAARERRGALQRVQAGYGAGARFRADASLAVQRFHLAERDGFKARVDAVLHGLQLKAAVGSLDEADIARTNSLLSSAAAAPSRQLP